MIEDRTKIQAKIVQLNLSDGGNWTDLQGFNAITTAHYLQNGNLVFNPNYGFIVKAFYNQTTGEVRTFDARFFAINS